MFRRAISLNPNAANYYHNLGETYRDMGEIGDAILLYEKALTLNPKLWQSHGSLSAIYYSKKDYQNASFHIEQALIIVPENTMLLQARKQIRMMNQ
jgi:tetratricopeptide (TPR) repeat protein